MKTASSLLIRCRSAMLLIGLLLGLMTTPRAEGKDPEFRLVCVTSLGGHEEFILASQKKSGRWKEEQTLKLRPSMMSPWIEAPAEELFLCVRDDRDLSSKGSFSLPKDAGRVLVVLMPGESADEFKVEVVDITRKSVGKGEVLVVNASDIAGDVALGDNKVEAKPGEASVHKPSLDEKGMYRMVVTYADESGKAMTCSDRYVQGNDTGRDFVILAADRTTGLQVTTVPDFGPFE